MTRILAVIAVLTLATAASAQAAAGFTKLANVSTTTYTDTTCPNLSTCFYQVTAVDASGHESQPATCDPATLCFGGNQVIAQMPSSGTHTVALTWAAPAGSGLTYNVYQHIGPLPPTAAKAVVN